MLTDYESMDVARIDMENIGNRGFHPRGIKYGARAEYLPRWQTEFLIGKIGEDIAGIGDNDDDRFGIQMGLDVITDRIHDGRVFLQ